MLLIPNRVQVGPYKYKVIEEQAVIDRERVEMGEQTMFAMIDKGNLRFALDPMLATDVKAECLLHELLHACFYTAGLDRAYPDNEEDLVLRLSPILLDTLRRNPELVDYLLDDDTPSCCQD